MNIQFLDGNVGGDPELKTFENGNKIATLSIATTEFWKDKQGEKKSKTTWHNLVFQGGYVDVVMKHVRKGDNITVTGSLSKRQYEKDGITREFVETKVDKLKIRSFQEQSTSSEPEPTNGDMNDLPF